MLKFSMLAEALSQERQEIQTREKAQAQVRISILYSFFLSFCDMVNTCIFFRCCRKQKEN